jgi:hypothetical protein
MHICFGTDNTQLKKGAKIVRGNIIWDFKDYGPRIVSVVAGYMIVVEEGLTKHQSRGFRQEVLGRFLLPVSQRKHIDVNNSDKTEA